MGGVALATAPSRHFSDELPFTDPPDRSLNPPRSRPRRGRMPRYLSLLLALAACAPAGADPADLPEWTAHPEWRVDAESADLTRVTALAISPDGELAIAQPMDDRVRLFTPEGQVRSLGRDGSGPGEFRFPSRVGYVGGDLYVVDPQAWRVSVFSLKSTPMAFCMCSPGTPPPAT